MVSMGANIPNLGAMQNTQVTECSLLNVPSHFSCHEKCHKALNMRMLQLDMKRTKNSPEKHNDRNKSRKSEKKDLEMAQHSETSAAISKQYALPNMTEIGGAGSIHSKDVFSPHPTMPGCLKYMWTTASPSSMEKKSCHFLEKATLSNIF